MFEPDKSLEACYETLNNLKSEAVHAARELSLDDPDLANLLSSLYIANQNQMMILWHLMARLEKKIDALADGGWPDDYGKKPKKRF